MDGDSRSLVALIDLWTSPLSVVAEGKPCNDARSIESSTFEGYENEYAIVAANALNKLIVIDSVEREVAAEIGARMVHIEFDRVEGD